ncbi:copper chaperone PCu(A)C [Nocardiopsis prasina]|uniref:copper chaperone PCu(A)C n=1 Tax=Nocardiopsis prasina TaxID=2015 RepID=UPI000346EBC2|nr:copper chaperone PCu(A)C [Nocardiopsis prasina]
MKTHTLTLLALALFVTGCSTDTAVREAVVETPERGGAEVDALIVEDAWMPEPANLEVGVVYMAITNTDASTADAVVDVRTDASPDAELCTTETSDSGAAVMRTLDEIPVPAGGTTTFVDGGYHVMVNDIPEPLFVGDSVTVTLGFASGTEIELDVPVQEMTGPTPDEADHGAHH